MLVRITGVILFIFGGSKITADGDFSHEIKRHLLLWRKVMTNLDSMLKSRDTTLPTKVRLVKAMDFPVVMYGCESWTVKKAEHQRIDAFELWCWRILLRVPWTARRSNQSILKEISPGCSLEGLTLKLKSTTLGTSCEELTHWKRLWRWEGLGAGGKGDDRGWDGRMASVTRWMWVWVNSGSWWWTRRPGVLRFMGLQGVGHDWATELDWTELKCGERWVIGQIPDAKLIWLGPGRSVFKIQIFSGELSHFIMLWSTVEVFSIFWKLLLVFGPNPFFSSPSVAWWEWRPVLASSFVRVPGLQGNKAELLFQKNPTTILSSPGTPCLKPAQLWVSWLKDIDTKMLQKSEMASERRWHLRLCQINFVGTISLSVITTFDKYLPSLYYVLGIEW